MPPGVDSSRARLGMGHSGMLLRGGLGLAQPFCAVAPIHVSVAPRETRSAGQVGRGGAQVIP